MDKPAQPLLDETTQHNYEALAKDWVIEQFYDADLDVEIANNSIFKVYGSRVYGGARKRSDLDIIMFYPYPVNSEGYPLDNAYHEDTLFNLLHEEKYRIDGIIIDINPINEFESGTLDEYIAKLDKWRDEDKTTGKNYTRDKRIELANEAAEADTAYEELTGDIMSGNWAKLKETGENFWIGCVSLIDGYIEEVHTYKEAKDADFHHTFIFSYSAYDRIETSESVTFFVQPKKKIYIWDNYDAPVTSDDKKAFLVGRIREQIILK